MESSARDPLESSLAQTKTFLAGDQSTGNLPVPRERYGRFKVSGKLGSGGFADVLLAHDPDLDRSVALKIPRPGQLRESDGGEQFVKEARTAARLQHPNIVQVYDVGIHEGVCYIVLEYVRGRTLEQVLTHESPSNLLIAALLEQIGEGLHHAHESGFVHRDIKPANILLDNEDRPKVSDFGLAIQHRDFNAPSNELAGTVRYMSPEQVRGESHRIDARTDIWALGVILYRAITKRHPFEGGSRHEILQRILYEDPVPPAQIVPTISAELQRICLKCLSRPMADRYRTARQFVQELMEWRETISGNSGRSSDRRRPFTIDPPSAPLIPRGLRAFSKDDSEFFLRLIPGPRDRDGLPTILRFWKVGIESCDAESTFRVGLLYGPSGCGKTSMIRAGLLPRLDRDVRAIFVDASAKQPEESLFSILKRSYPEVSTATDLSIALQILRDERGAGTQQKILIVIDQFEQWLQSWDFQPDASLISALRQCDGISIQCLILVRDDFWLPISRFMHALEVSIIEGQNAMLIDSFDSSHAFNILREFGAAYQCLPPNGESLSSSQTQFLKEAVEVLSHDGRLYPVRLAVFIEMFRRLEWIPSTLATLGGPDGIGVAFLDSMFGSTASQPRRAQEPLIRRLLSELLPETGQIKGPVRSYSELRKACGFSDKSAVFDETIRLLDGELRIITPANQTLEDSGILRSSDHDSGKPLVEPGYQLTHDFLVQSIRKYLLRGQQSTRTGRAMLMLAEQADVWQTHQSAKFLPTFWEWLTIKSSTSRSDWNSRQQSMMVVATRRVARQALYVAAVMATVLTIAILARNRFQQSELQREAMLAADRVVAGPSSELKGALQRLSTFTPLVSSDLRKTFNDNSAPMQVRMRAAAGLLPQDPDMPTWLVDQLLHPTSVADDFVPLRDTIVRHAGADVRIRLKKLLDDSSTSERQRFRVMSLLAGYEDSRGTLKAHVNELFHSLLREPAADSRTWIEAIKPAAAELIDGFSTNLLQVESAEHASIAAAAILTFDPQQFRTLTSILLSAGDVQYRAIMEILQQQPEVARAQLQKLIAIVPDARDNAPAAEPDPMREVNFAMAMWQFGDQEPLRRMSHLSPDPTVRTLLIHSMNPVRVDASALSDLILESADGDPVLNVSLSAFVSHLDDIPKISVAPRLTERIRELFLTHRESETHSLCELLLRKVGEEPTALLAGRTELSKSDAERNWYINRLGMCMIVIRPSELSRRFPGITHKVPDHDYAISATEITCEQMLKLVPEWKRRLVAAAIVEESPTDWPAGNIDVDHAELFCLRLSEHDGIKDSEWCYSSDKNLGVKESLVVPDYLQKTGYRIPTDEEWMYVCRCCTSTDLSIGTNRTLLPHYAWSLPFSEGNAQPVAKLLPNQFGLFDCYGNVAETCFTQNGSAGDYLSRGGNFFSVPTAIQTDAISPLLPGAVGKRNGLRVIRTFRAPED